MVLIQPLWISRDRVVPHNHMWQPTLFSTWYPPCCWVITGNRQHLVPSHGEASDLNCAALSLQNVSANHLFCLGRGLGRRKRGDGAWRFEQNGKSRNSTWSFPQCVFRHEGFVPAQRNSKTAQDRQRREGKKQRNSCSL